MGVINLDDGKARIELLIFSGLFDANRAWLKEDRLLVNTEVKRYQIARQECTS